MSKLCIYVNDNRLCQSFSGMSNLGGNVKLTSMYVKLMQVCRAYLKKFVKVTRICRSNTGMPNLCVYVKVIQVCQSYTGMTILYEYVKLVWVIGYVKLKWEFQTYTGMSGMSY